MTTLSWKFTTMMNIKFHRKNKRALCHTLENSETYLELLLTTIHFGLDRVWVTLSCMWPLRCPGRCPASCSRSRMDQVSQKSNVIPAGLHFPIHWGQGGPMHLRVSSKMSPVEFLLMNLCIALRCLSFFTQFAWQSSWETGTARLCVCVSVYDCVCVCLCVCVRVLIPKERKSPDTGKT